MLYAADLCFFVRAKGSPGTGKIYHMNLLLSAPSLNVYEQMALDECLVRTRPNDITLRFYRWTDSPAVTFGYSQFAHEVKKTLAARAFWGPYARRPTGGGVVFHQSDLTFSLVFVSAERPSDIYKKFHHFILAELAARGINSMSFNKALPASAYAPSVNHTANACFINPVENDLLSADGHKILGGAIRRFGQTVLYQGSLQVPDGRDNPLYKNAVIGAVRSFLGADLRPCGASAALISSARRLADEQYKTLAWTEKF